MGAARNTVPKWVDPDLPWGETDEPAKAEAPSLVAVVDRFHNHEDMSPEAMAQAIAELQEAVKVLDARLATVQGEAADAASAAKGLGVNMVHMGDALSRRVRSLEESAEAEAERAAEQALAAEAAMAKRRSTNLVRTLTAGLFGRRQS